MLRFTRLIIAGLALLHVARGVEAFAQPSVGISAFPIMSKNFQGEICDRFIRLALQSPVPTIAVLHATFGVETECLYEFWERVEKKNKRHITEIHFSNEAGRRAARLDVLDFQRGLDPTEYNQLLERMPRSLKREIRLRVRAIKGMIKPGENSGQFILSTGLEDEYSAKAWDNLYAVIRQNWPHQIVRSRVLNGKAKKNSWAAPEGVLEESHGYGRRMDQPNCIGNGDGQDVNFLPSSGFPSRDTTPANREQVKAWIARGKANNCIMFLWAAKWQGIFGSAPIVKPLSRRFRIDEEDINLLKGLLRSAS